MPVSLVSYNHLSRNFDRVDDFFEIDDSFTLLVVWSLTYV